MPRTQGRNDGAWTAGCLHWLLPLTSMVPEHHPNILGA